jgi:hypothetical protein
MRTVISIVAVGALVGTAMGQASFGPTGYTQDFNSMGTSGTTRPLGFSHYFVTGSNDTYNAASTNAAIATTLPSFTLRNRPLALLNQSGTASPSTQSATSTTASYGYNAAFSSNAANRILGVAGASGVGGSAIELTLTNNSGAARTSVDFSYDWVALGTGPGQSGFTGNMLPGQESELPGFRVFVSLNGNAGPWTNVPALNFVPPVSTPIGTVTTVAGTSIALPATWNTGAVLSVRWFKDNEDRASPDPLYGIDNVRVIPTPGAAALLGLGVLAAGRRRR